MADQSPAGSVEELQVPLDSQEEAIEQLDTIIDEVERVSNASEVAEDTKQQATEIAKQAVHTGLRHYPSIAELAVGCLYLACRKSREPRHSRDLTEQSSIPRFTNTYGTVDERSEMRGRPKRRLFRSYDIISEALDTDLDSNTVEVAAVISQQIDGHTASGKSPAAVAVGIIDYATNRTDSSVTQREIVTECNFSRKTVRVRRQDIEEDLT